MSLESASGEAHHLFSVPMDMAWNLGSVPCRMADLGRLQNPPDRSSPCLLILVSGLFVDLPVLTILSLHFPALLHVL